MLLSKKDYFLVIFLKNLLPSEPSTCKNKESPILNYKLTEIVNHHTKCYALQSYSKKSSRLFGGRTPSSASSAINILLYPLHNNAIVVCLWLDRGHNETHCRLDAQLIACLRTAVIRSIFLQVTFEIILPDTTLHHVSGHITLHITPTAECN